MSSVIFDYTRIISAFRMPSEPRYTSGETHLFLYDLIKFIEAIVLYDSILTTVNIRDIVLDWEKKTKKPEGLFDLSKEMYKEIFTSIVKQCPKNMDSKIDELRSNLEKTREPYCSSEYRFYYADIASLPEIRKILSSDFQWLNETKYDVANDVYILNSMVRVRTLLTMASIMNIPYVKWTPCQD